MAARAPWTLNRRLVLTVVAVLMVVSAIIGVVSVLVLQTSLMQRTDAELASTIQRGSAAVGFRVDQGYGPDSLPRAFDIVRTPGQSVGTLAAVVDSSGDVHDALYINTAAEIRGLTNAQATRAAEVPIDGKAHSVDLGGSVGSYRLVALSYPTGGTIVIGVPLAGVYATVAQLGVTITLVALVGIVIVAVLGSYIVRIALRPLARVTQTAQRVSRMKLDRGDVAIAERVSTTDADERTEVGQVGAALNSMLDHIGAALQSRQKSEQKVRQFVADASHELRTPLASIRGYSELTRRSGQEVPPDIAHALSRIESESVRMTALVEDLLLLARLDEGRELAREPVDLTLLLVDAVGDAHASGSDHVWELDLPEEPLEVLGDAPRLQQVFINLLANARVHTPAGTLVRVGLEDDGASAVVTVTDDGPGIDPSVAATLFERFARGDSSRNRATGSTGLGLAIVRGVVTAQGGSVSVASQPGATTFTVILPKAPEATPDPADPAAPAARPATPATPTPTT